MSVAVQFTTIDDILVARGQGDWDPHWDEVFDRAVAAECALGGYGKILIDLREVGGDPTSFESYRSGTSLEERGFSRTTRIAYLDRLEFKRANEMYGLVARNRGFLLRHFYEEPAALEWLGKADLQRSDSG